MVALVELAQIFRVEIRQIVQRHGIVRSQGQQLFIGVAGVLIILLGVVGHAHEQQCAGILRVFGQRGLQVGQGLLVLIGGGVELGQHQIRLLGIGLQLDGLLQRAFRLVRVAPGDHDICQKQLQRRRLGILSDLLLHALLRGGVLLFHQVQIHHLFQRRQDNRGASLSAWSNSARAPAFFFCWSSVVPSSRGSCGFVG